jgi:cell fate regulator YaaT (PSP1 superfamily)
MSNIDNNSNENKTDNPKQEQQPVEKQQSERDHGAKKPKYQGQSNQSEQSSRYKEGQVLRFVRVRFPGNAKSFPFLVGKRRISYGQKVVAMSDRGMAVGYINSFPYEQAFTEKMLPIRSISKVASDKDIEQQYLHYKKEKEYETLCKNLIEKHSLEMNLTHVEFTQFGKKAVFYFTAPARVDFRNLVKDLVGKLKLRIELRQISVRDRAASIGGLGPCGRQLCCSSFLNQYGNVSIKFAKNQNLTLTHSKLNGVCGQLKCCLQYEDTVYSGKRKKLPRIGELIMTESGLQGRVERLNLLQDQFDLLLPEGVMKRCVATEYKGKADKDFTFPKYIKHIVDETQNVLGLEDFLAEKAALFKDELEVEKEQAKQTVEDIFQQHLTEELNNIKDNKVAPVQ